MATKRAKAGRPAPEDEVGWTVRMPRALRDRVHARAAALTAEGRGRWSGNLVVVEALTREADAWDARAAATAPQPRVTRGRERG